MITLCLFIDELIEISDLTHQRVLDLFHLATTDRSRDLQPVTLCEGGFHIDLFLDLCFRFTVKISCQPQDDMVDLALRTSFLLRLAYIQRIFLRYAHTEYSIITHTLSGIYYKRMGHFLITRKPIQGLFACHLEKKGQHNSLIVANTIMAYVQLNL